MSEMGFYRQISMMSTKMGSLQWNKMIQVFFFNDSSSNNPGFHFGFKKSLSLFMNAVHYSCCELWSTWAVIASTREL